MKSTIIPLICFIFLILVKIGSSQEAVLGKNSNVFSTENKYGGGLTSFGWTLFGQHNQYQGVKNRVFLALEISNLKDPKEIKSFNPYYEDAKGYFYGKLNHVLLFKPSIGREKLLSEKYRKTGVQISYQYSVGASFAMVKPVYLKIGLPYFPYRYIEIQQYDPEKHSIDDIFGRASYFNGFDKMKMHFGANLKMGLNFEYANEAQRIKGISLGAFIDMYTKEIPIMAFNENKRIFAGFYVALFYGNKNVR